jgi:hypothetical protein
MAADALVPAPAPTLHRGYLGSAEASCSDGRAPQAARKSPPSPAAKDLQAHSAPGHPVREPVIGASQPPW